MKRCFVLRGFWKVKYFLFWIVVVEDEEEGEGFRGVGEWVWLEGVFYFIDGFIVLLIIDGWFCFSVCFDECMGRCIIGK